MKTWKQWFTHFMETDCFEIFARVSRRYISTMFTYILLRLSTWNIHRSNKRKWLLTVLQKLIRTDYADDLVLLVNTLTQAESLLHSLEQAAGRIGLYMNANKTESVYFKQKRAFFILSAKPLKSVDQFIPWQQHLINWKWCQHRLSIIWKFNTFDKME